MRFQMVHLEDYLNERFQTYEHANWATYFFWEEIFVHAISFFKLSLASLICSTMFKS